MSQQRPRKNSGVDHSIRGRSNVTKGSGDNAVSNRQYIETNRSKHKIPKSLRYGLDNALISLCDVWFEDIKPHLIRNNIKVHAHPAVASGDHKPTPCGASRCSHVDPGAAPDHQRRQLANSAGCFSTQPIASKAPSHRQLSPLCQRDMYLPNHPASQIQSPFPSYKQKKRRQKSRRLPSSQEWKVPRLCRTYSVIAPTPPVQLRRPATEKLYRKPPKWRRPKMIDKCTQTPAQWQPPINTAIHQETFQTTPTMPTCKQLRKNRKEIPHHSIVPQKYTNGKSSCLRIPATTTFFPNRSRKESPDVPVLFQDDLIDIIAEKNDKQLRLLFRSPPHEDSCSTINLLHALPVRSALVTKKVPWR